MVEYPDEVKTRYDRTIYEVARIPDGHKVGNFHIPLTVDGYRAVYKGYLADPDLQDARARWPFVAHVGQPRILVAGLAEHRQGGAVRAAWPERQGRRESGLVRISSRPRRSAERVARAVRSARGQGRPDRGVRRNGLGMEPNNLIAINSLKAYRALRYGKHLDLIITDQHSYRSADPFSDPSLGKLGGDEFTACSPRTSMQVLDGGRAFNGGNPPAEIRFNDAHVANPQRRRAAANDSRGRAEGLVQGPAQELDGDVEDLGRTRSARSISAPTRRTCPRV